MRRIAGRMQTLGAGMLVLAVTVAAPSLSAAQQDAGDPNAVPADPPPTTPDTPGEGGTPEDGSADGDAGLQQVAEATAEETAVPEPKAAPEKRAKAAAVKTVSIGDNFYTPRTISITVGDTVTWKNDGASPHSATAEDGSFDTGVFNGGQSRSETFSTAGTIPYFCTVHGQVQSGTIKVLSSGGGGGGSGASSSGTSEANAVTSPGAAGSSTSLPATGFGAIVLAAVGMALLGSGSALRRRL